MAYMQYCRSILRRSSDTLHHPILFAAQGVGYRKLDVILTTSIDKLGNAGEAVKVAPGHFRNHLMPKLLAVPNIDKFAYLISEQRKIYQTEEVEEVKVVQKTVEDRTKEYQTAAKRLDDAKLVLKRHIKIDNELREPVTKVEIVAEVMLKLIVEVDLGNLKTTSEQISAQQNWSTANLALRVARQLCVRIEPDNLHLPTPWTSLGEFEVPLNLPMSIPLPPGEVQWALDVKIRRK